MDVFISPAREHLSEIAPIYYLFGGEMFRNALRDFNGSQKKIKILFLGCHDLRNVLNTISSKNIKDDHHLKIYLNHACPVSFARNVLILKVMSATGFNVNNTADLGYLWDLWYNAEWAKTTLERFKKDVKDLVEKGLPKNCVLSLASDSTQLSKLQNIWIGWLSSLTSLTKSSNIKKILKERLQFIFTNDGTIGSNSNSHILSEGLDRLVMWSEAAMLTEHFPEKLKKKLSNEARSFYQTGSCNPKKHAESVAFNPTLLEPNTLFWRIDSNSPSPYDSFFPLPLGELEIEAEGGIITRYCQKILKNLLVDFIRQKKNIEFHLSLSDDLKLCYSETFETFDVIDCSNLADKVGLANLIVAGSRRLEPHSDSLLITESIMWSSMATTLRKYVEDSLCAPLSMIPTIYGLRLATHVELGSATYTERAHATGCPPLTLNWRPAPRFANVSLDYSSSLERCLKNLEKKCHLILGSNRSVSEYCGLKCYTPLLFKIVNAKLTEFATKKEGCCQTKFLQSKVAPHFVLAHQTLDDWANEYPVTVLKFTQPFTPTLENWFDKHKLFEIPMLRIVLVPEDYYLVHIMKNAGIEKWAEIFPRDLAAEVSNVHYIDNLDFCKFENGQNISSVQVAFLLPKEHDFVQTHCAVLVDILTGHAIMFIGAVKDMQQQIYEKSHLTKTSLYLPSEVSHQIPYMQAESCKESETDYIVTIAIHAENEPKDFNISTDQQYPSCAAHSITVSFTETEGFQPLTLRFPYPFLVGCIGTTLNRSERFIKVVLKKAVYEPWPCHFSDQPKWNADNLDIWTEPRPEESVTEFLLHIGQTKDMISHHQHLVCELDPSKYRPPTPINDVRGMLASFFSFAREEEFEQFMVYKKNEPNKLLWHIRAHHPIRMSPSGTPLILISALDRRLSEKFIAEGHLDSKKADEDFQRIFEKGRKKKYMPMVNETEEGIDLLRYVIRLNSSKIEPSSWQKKNVPLGKHSPYVASFFTPLYMDNPLSQSYEEFEALENEIELMKTLVGRPIREPNRCSYCGRESMKLKCCAKCKCVYYCNADCQRAHWKEHKKQCGILDK